MGRVLSLNLSVEKGIKIVARLSNEFRYSLLQGFLFLEENR